MTIRRWLGRLVSNVRREAAPAPVPKRATIPGGVVVLRDVEDDDGVRHLWASLTDEGDLLIKGHDLGEGVKRVLGVGEYEWGWTIRAAHIPALLGAMGASGDVMSALSERFSDERAGDLEAFFKEHEVPREFWSRRDDE